MRFLPSNGHVRVKKKQQLIPIIIALLLISCSDQPTLSTLTFKPVYNQSTIVCEKQITTEFAWQLDQLWFYLSNLEVKTKLGWQEAKLTNNQWQHQNVALLGQHCIDSDDANWQVAIAQSAPLDSITQLRFTIGLPFSKNHQSPMRAQSIFANSNMFWTWQQGYKYLRLDLEHSATEQNWAFHLGATGCQSPSPIRPPANACKNPNTVTIDLDFDDTGVLAFDLARLFKQVELNKQTRCLALPTQPSCPTLIENLANTVSFSKLQANH